MNHMDALKKFVDLATEKGGASRLARIVRVKGARADVKIVRNDGSIDADFPELPDCPLPSRLTGTSGYYSAPVPGALCLVSFPSEDISKPYIVAVYSDVAADGVTLRNENQEIQITDKISLRTKNSKVEISTDGVTVQTALANITINDTGVALTAVSFTLNGEMVVNGTINCSGPVTAPNIP